MFFDALTIAATREELLAGLVPGRVQQVRAVGPLALGLEIYGARRRRHLLLSAHAENARVHLLAAPPTRDPTVRSPLLLLLRKYVRGAVLQTIEQPQFERVLDFGFTKVLPVQKHGPPGLDEADLADEEDEDGADEPFDDRRTEIPPGFALYETHLIAEIMGRHSNIVLVGADGLVLDAVKHVPSSINRYRTTLPHLPYVPPPPQRKLDLLTMGARSFRGELDELDPNIPLWQALVARFRAVSPLLAREAVYRATGREDVRVVDADAPPLFAALQETLGLARTHAWQPTIAWAPEESDLDEDDESSDADPEAPPASKEAPPPGREALAFAPYPLHHLEAAGATLEATESISAAAEAFYAALETVAGHAQLKAAVRVELNERRARLERRRRSLQAELDRAAGFEKERHKGELILAYMYGLTPGQTRLEIPEEDLVITLDPDRPPLEQAQALFREYQRARAAVEGVPARLEAVDLGLRYLDEIATQLDLAADHDTIQLLRTEIAALPEDPGARPPTPREEAPAKRPPPKPDRKNRKPRLDTRPATRESRLATTPGKATSRDGFTLLYGRSARQNDALTFGLARPDDLWLHARGVPGSHVVIRATGRPIPESTVAEAARLAARHSKARAASAVDVIVTEKRHVRRFGQNAPPGLVRVDKERVLRVRLDKDEDK